jgi:competence protein ComEA
MRNLKIIGFTLLVVFSGMVHAGKVNINTAGAEQIATELVGVGAVRANAIIVYRAKNGQFKSIEEVANVPGIGKKTVEKNRDNIVMSMVKKSNK